MIAKTPLWLFALVMFACQGASAGPTDDDGEGGGPGEVSGGAGEPGGRGGAGGMVQGAGGGLGSTGGATQTGGSAGAGQGGGAAAAGAGGQPSGGGMGGAAPTNMGGAAGMVGTPDPVVVPVAEQKQVMLELFGKVCRGVVTYDANDNVIALNFSSHQSFCGTQEHPGLSDDDMQKLLKFPSLRRVRFERMNRVTSAGYGVLAKLKNLEAALFAYPDGANKDFMLSVKDNARLKVLELKHLFSISGTSLPSLPAYQDLRVLELDNASAERSVALPFIKKHPALISLQLHRTSLTNADVSEIADTLPNLEGIELKPAGSSMNNGVFEHLGRMKKLKVIQLAGGLSVPAWEAGGKYLEGLTNLRLIVGTVDGGTEAKLKAAIPGFSVAGSGSQTQEQSELRSKDNIYFMRSVLPFFLTDKKEEYKMGTKQSTVGSEDIG
ncbi:MAG: hypothetical protein SF187_06070 [Deltaproteobacteria bacterium]|nr:hypothetical protein [Deltaproteobacteria bacterium]